MTADEIRIWPRLSRFYGISPFELQNLPRPLLEIYTEEMASIRAEEQLERIQAADQPHVIERHRERIHRQLMRLAGIEAPSEEVDPLKDAGVGALAGLGIKVVRSNA